MTTGELNRIRRCANKCFFCFVDGLPAGLRQSLYVKDDDILHSFFLGNFITFTNFREVDWERLEERRLSPLFVSVHATDLDLRRRMLGNPKAPDIMEQLRRLGSLRIQVHAQIVLCPGVNDGDQLAKTVENLASLYPTVQSVAVVPVGITKHTVERRENLVARPDARQAAEIIKLLVLYQQRFRREIGIALVYPADELYLMTDIPIPLARRYDGFPQLGNGIGMTRKLLDEWQRLRRKLSSRSPSPALSRCRPRRVAVVCGTLIASSLGKVVDELDQLDQAGLELAPVPNDFFGPSVTVSGLLTGGDVISTFRRRGPVDLLVLPRNMLDASGGRFLDDLTPQDVERATGAEVAVAANLHQLVQVLAHHD